MSRAISFQTLSLLLLFVWKVSSFMNLPFCCSNRLGVRTDHAWRMERIDTQLNTVVSGENESAENGFDPSVDNLEELGIEELLALAREEDPEWLQQVLNDSLQDLLIDIESKEKNLGVKSDVSYHDSDSGSDSDDVQELQSYGASATMSQFAESELQSPQELTTTDEETDLDTGIRFESSSADVDVEDSSANDILQSLGYSLEEIECLKPVVVDMIVANRVARPGSTELPAPWYKRSATTRQRAPAVISPAATKPVQRRVEQREQQEQQEQAVYRDLRPHATPALVNGDAAESRAVAEYEASLSNEASQGQPPVRLPSRGAPTSDYSADNNYYDIGNDDDDGSEDNGFVAGDDEHDENSAPMGRSFRWHGVPLNRAERETARSLAAADGSSGNAGAARDGSSSGNNGRQRRIKDQRFDTIGKQLLYDKFNEDDDDDDDDDEDNITFWPSVDEFKDMLLDESRFRLEVAGGSWIAPLLREENKWRFRLYEGWKNFVEEGFGDSFDVVDSDDFDAVYEGDDEYFQDDDGSSDRSVIVDVNTPATAAARRRETSNRSQSFSDIKRQNPRSSSSSGSSSSGSSSSSSSSSGSGRSELQREAQRRPRRSIRNNLLPSADDEYKNKVRAKDYDNYARYIEEQSDALISREEQQQQAVRRRDAENYYRRRSSPARRSRDDGNDYNGNSGNNGSGSRRSADMIDKDAWFSDDTDFDLSDSLSDDDDDDDGYDDGYDHYERYRRSTNNDGTGYNRASKRDHGPNRAIHSDDSAAYMNFETKESRSSSVVNDPMRNRAVGKRTPPRQNAVNTRRQAPTRSAAAATTAEARMSVNSSGKNSRRPTRQGAPRSSPRASNLADNASSAAAAGFREFGDSYDGMDATDSRSYSTQGGMAGRNSEEDWDREVNRATNEAWRISEQRVMIDTFPPSNPALLKRPYSKLADDNNRSDDPNR